MNININNLQRSFERFNTLANILRGLRGMGNSTISIDLTLWELEDIAELLYEKISSDNPQSKTGRWIHNKCDKCGASRPPLFDNFCPHCGAKMETAENGGGKKDDF